MLADLLTSGRLVAAIAGLVVLEGLALAAYVRRTGRGPALRPTLLNLGAGLALLLALRAALVDAPWLHVAGWLGAAGVAHVADLTARWER